MLRNYFTVAFRNLIKHWTYSTLTIAGLAVGLATTLLILLWVKDEISYDRFHRDHSDIYKVLLNVSVPGQEIQTYQSVVPILAATLKEQVPGVELASRFSGEQALFTYQEKNIQEKGYSVDGDFLQLFSFPLLKGDKHMTHQEPNSLLVTQRLAEKYFGQQEPLGKIIRIDQATDYKVVGVLANVPVNSSLQFDYLRPVLQTANSASWVDNTDNVYVKLDKKAHLDQVQAQLKVVTQQHLPEWVKDRHYFLHPLEDWYLKTDFKNGQYAGGGRITYVRLFGMIALLVLLIACFNFINLSTARATHRAKEVGVRKVVGAGKGSLMGQFLLEYLLLTSFASLIALALVLLVLPWFNELFEKQLVIEWANPFYLTAYIGLLLLTSLLAGLYPALVLSSFQPVKAVKGLRENVKGGVVWLRKILVVGQFTASIILLIGTGVVYQQLQFIQHRKLGYGKENLLWFEAKDLAQFPRSEQAKAALAGVPGVEAISLANSSFQGSYGRNYVEWKGKQDVEKAMFAILHADHQLIPTLQLRLAAGRNFSTSFATDSTNFLINEAAVRQMNMEHPVGQLLKVNNVEGRIIGVVKDFHIASVHHPIEPVVLVYRRNTATVFFVRIKGQPLQATLAGLAQRYKDLLPGQPFEYHFVDQQYEKMYRSELQIGTLAKGFSLLAIFISCLGLLGLAAYSVERRTKEIGIRKVLGASLPHILTLISQEFLLLVLISLLVAALPAWYLMEEWLDKFYYHVEISWWIIVLAGVLVLCLALLTVSVQAIKAASTDPVKSLRTE